MPGRALLLKLDAWMRVSPWRPRVTPWATYLILLTLVSVLRGVAPWTYPLAYSVMCAATLWLLWRYRSLLPELNWRFHVLCVPVGVGVTVAWVGLGRLMGSWQPQAFGSAGEDMIREMGEPVAVVSLGLRLLGMSIVVPMFEELFIRSMLLRAFHRGRVTLAAVLRVMMDFPVIGDMLLGSRVAEWVERQTGSLTQTFERTAVGALSWCGVGVSTFAFMMSHAPRDWPGCVACGLAYCGLAWWTNRGPVKRGLGPVVWAHGITNATLWGYTVVSNDWRFL